MVRAGFATTLLQVRAGNHRRRLPYTILAPGRRPPAHAR
jgi:hypothetical protein